LGSEDISRGDLGAMLKLWNQTAKLLVGLGS
jgi:hypothetical protein